MPSASDQKLLSLESQIAACARKEASVIICPYCNTENRSDNERLCCNLMGKAVSAILERERLRNVQDTVSRILENAEMN